MPRKSSKANAQPVEAPPVEAPVEESEPQPTIVSKEEYQKARQTIKRYRETKKQQPKRPCSEKQLAALKAGRERNKRFAKKQSDQ